MRKSFINSLKEPGGTDQDIPRSASGGGFGVPIFKGGENTAAVSVSAGHS